MAKSRTVLRQEAANTYTINTIGSEGDLQHRSEVFTGSTSAGEELESPQVLLVPGQSQIFEIKLAANPILIPTTSNPIKVQSRIHFTGRSPGVWTDVETLTAGFSEAEIGDKSQGSVFFNESVFPREFRVLMSAAQSNATRRIVLSIKFSNI